MFCPECSEGLFTQCTNCHSKVHVDDVEVIHDNVRFNRAMRTSSNNIGLCKRCASLRSTCEFCGTEFVKERTTDSNLCHTCRDAHTDCILCGEKIYRYGSDSNLGQASVTILIPGSLYAHRVCLDKDRTRTCSVCGKKRVMVAPRFYSNSYTCLGCTIAQAQEAVLGRYIKRIKEFFQSVKYITVTATEAPTLSDNVNKELLSSVPTTPTTTNRAA